MCPTTLVSSTVTAVTPNLRALVKPRSETTCAMEEFEIDHRWCGDGKVTTAYAKKFKQKKET